MPTLIDESGDTGQARDSLPYFRLAAVWMPTQDSLASFREDVRQLRRDLHLDDASSSSSLVRAHTRIAAELSFVWP